jgi:RNA polymerase sigma factor (sigma-70 family)
LSNSPLVEKTIGHLFRHEAGRMAAVLTRMLGTAHLDDVYDIVQDTLLKALEVWKFKGIPENPSAWLYTVARNRAIDLLRKRKSSVKLESQQAQQIEDDSIADDWEKSIEDSVLRMMFACCHPAIPVESQIAFTLKTLGGLTVKEIASAFLTSEETVAKRIYRAKEKIREEKIELEAPSVFELPSRLDSVLKVLYLLFNEGYYSSNPEFVVREDLCAEAIRLTNILAKHPQIGLPQVKALLALMCLQAARFPARADDQNQIILLEHQDRTKWNQALTKQGLYFLEQASTGDWLTEYHVEAAIASIHALAPSFAETKWKVLLELYETLHQLKPTQSTELNKAIATGFAISAAAGVEALKQLQGLESSQYYHVALADFLLKCDNKPEADTHLMQALLVTQSSAERQLIQEKINRLNPSGRQNYAC